MLHPKSDVHFARHCTNTPRKTVQIRGHHILKKEYRQNLGWETGAEEVKLPGDPWQNQEQLIVPTSNPTPYPVNHGASLHPAEYLAVVEHLKTCINQIIILTSTNIFCCLNVNKSTKKSLYIKTV